MKAEKEEPRFPILRQMLLDAGVTFATAEPRKGAGEDVPTVCAVAGRWRRETGEGKAVVLSPRHAETLAFGAYWALLKEKHPERFK